MVWLQENWIVALVVLIVVIALVWWLAARRKPRDVVPPTVEAKPAKPLEPARPDIVAAEPAFKKAPAAAPTPPPPAPAPAPAPAPKVEPAPPPAAPAPAPAPAAKADNLQYLKGVGPKLAKLLNDLGVTRFEQIAGWSEADIAAIDPQLGNFSGRIARDDWVDQARYLARGDKAGFEAKYGALGGEL